VGRAGGGFCGMSIVTRLAASTCVGESPTHQGGSVRGRSGGWAYGRLGSGIQARREVGGEVLGEYGVRAWPGQ
jgi:hypothetical protein